MYEPLRAMDTPLKSFLICRNISEFCLSFGTIEKCMSSSKNEKINGCNRIHCRKWDKHQAERCWPGKRSYTKTASRANKCEQTANNAIVLYTDRDADTSGGSDTGAEWGIVTRAGGGACLMFCRSHESSVKQAVTVKSAYLDR